MPTNPNGSSGGGANQQATLGIFDATTAVPSPTQRPLKVYARSIRAPGISLAM